MSNAKLPAPTPRAIKKCAEVMAEMLRIGWSKDDLPTLENLFWRVRDPRTGEVAKPLQVEGPTYCPLCKHNLFEGRCVNPNCPYDQRQLAPKAGAEATGKSKVVVFESQAVAEYKEKLRKAIRSELVEVNSDIDLLREKQWAGESELVGRRDGLLHTLKLIDEL